jgi:RRXRR protein
VVFVPVVDQSQQPLMPTTPSRARRWIKEKKATPFWKRGVFCVRLNVEPSQRVTQPMAIGIDPGSKREGLSVVSAAHAYLHIQAEAVTWVSDHVKTRRQMRRARRSRKTPYRPMRKNRARGGLPPSTKARWQWKLRLCRWLMQMYPVTTFVVEDIKAATKGKRRWDAIFSPLQVGKQWMYAELGHLAPVASKQGWETKTLRDAAGLKKTSKKLAEVFEAHAVDSFVLARCAVGGALQPDNTQLLCVTPLRFHRRQLHRLQPDIGGMRKPYGGTRSHGLTRGSLVHHARYGVVYVGGWLKDRMSLHHLSDGKRVTQQARPAECRFLTYNSWRTKLVPR